MKALKEALPDRRPLRRREQRALRRLMPRKLLVLTAQSGQLQPTYGIVNDISDAGTGIVADRLLPSGRDVRLRICFYPQVCFDTEARVVWGRDGLHAHQSVHGLALNGLQFAGPLDLATLGSPEVLRFNAHAHHDSQVASILEYLEYQIPKYPFNRRLDTAFVTELLADFPHLDILEEIKTFRWYYDSDPVAHVANPRASLRRWISGSTGAAQPALWTGNGPRNGTPVAGYRWNGSTAADNTSFRNWVSFLKA